MGEASSCIQSGEGAVKQASTSGTDPYYIPQKRAWPDNFDRPSIIKDMSMLIAQVAGFPSSINTIIQRAAYARFIYYIIRNRRNNTHTDGKGPEENNGFGGVCIILKAARWGRPRSDKMPAASWIIHVECTRVRDSLISIYSSLCVLRKRPFVSAGREKKGRTPAAEAKEAI